MSSKAKKRASNPPKVIVCLTGFGKADIEALSQIIGNIGCVFESSLTNRTTHLVCATTNSSKYACAQRAGIICVTREWLDVSDAEGHPVPEVCPFIVPPLFGCTICPTGLSKGERATVERDCLALGATFSGDLTSSVTHLITKAASRSRKYLYALQRRIAIVTPDWIRRAAQTHSHPDETIYSVGSKTPPPPLEEISVTSAHSSSSQMSMSSSDPVDPIVKERDSKPITIAKAEDDDEAPKPLKGCNIAFYGFTTEQRVPLKRLLKELGAGNAVPLDSPDVTHVVVSSNPDIAKIDYKHPPFAKTALVVEPRWLVACYQVNTRLNEALFRPAESVPSPAPFMESSVEHPSFMEQTNPGVLSQRRITQTVERTLFSGLLFAIIGFDTERMMQCRNLVCSHGGMVFYEKEGETNAEAEAKVNYIILPHGYSIDERTKLKNERFTSAQFASADWLELCEKTNVVLDLARSPVLTPLKVTPPFETMLDIVLSFSGFGGQDRLIHTALAHRLGASVTTTFARRANTHLVAASPSGDKFKAACRWGIPVVSINWLRQCAQMGDCAPVLQYLLPCSHDGLKSATTAGTRMPRSKSTILNANSAPQFWTSFSSSSPQVIPQQTVPQTQPRKHRKSQPALLDTAISSASAAEFAPPDTILPSISGVSSKSAARYLGGASMQSRPAEPFTIGDGPDSSSSNDETSTTDASSVALKPAATEKKESSCDKHEDKHSPPQATANKEETRHRKRSVVKLDVTVCSMDDSDLDEDTLELPAAQMSMFLQPEEPRPNRGKRCSTGDKIMDENFGAEDESESLSRSAIVNKKLNRESNPECVVTYEHNRMRDSTKL